jgi:hypothetical protein
MQKKRVSSQQSKGILKLNLSLGTIIYLSLDFDLTNSIRLAREEVESFYDFFGDGNEDEDEAKETGFVDSLYEESVTHIEAKKEDRIERVRSKKGTKAAQEERIKLYGKKSLFLSLIKHNTI